MKIIITVFESLLRDVGYALRQLCRTPVFAITAILTMTIGVTANSTMISLIDALMFRPPAHVKDPDSLGWISSARNYPGYQRISDDSRAIDASVWTQQKVTYDRGVNAAETVVSCVSHTYFPLLGAQPIVGRNFSKTEDVQGSPNSVAIISHDFWRRRFEGDSSVIGKDIWLSGNSFTVIGVAPKGFRGVETPANALNLKTDVWLLLTQAPVVCSSFGIDLLASSGSYWLYTLGRLRPGFTRSQAEAELSVFFTPDTVSSSPTTEFQAIYRNGRRVDLSRDGRISIWLASASLLLLIISCVNVTNLLLIRYVERRREIMIRLQMGASRARIFCQLLTENCVLMIISGLVSVALLLLTIPWIFHLFPAVGGENFPDYRMLLTTAMVAAAATLATGVFPAFHATRPEKGGALQQGYSVVSSRSTLRNALVVTQIALALALTIGAGLFVRSVRNIEAIDLGYNPDRMLAITIDLNRSGFSPAEISGMYEQMLERVKQLPSVESAALGSSYNSGWLITGFFPDSRIQVGAEIQPVLDAVSPDYFSTFGTRILLGRAFTVHDTWQSAPVAIVGEGLVKTIWPGEDPIGKCISLGTLTCIEVVGVCETRKTFSNLPGFGDIFQEWFVPLSQMSIDDPNLKRSAIPPSVLFIRAREKSGSMGSVAAAVRSTIAPISPEMPFIKIEPVANRFDNQTRQWNLGAKIFSYFGAIALAVSAIGVYGVLAFFIRSRTAEIGLRMALGATRVNIAFFILRKGFIPVVIGIALGIELSRRLSKLLQNQLFGLEHTDPASFAIAVGVIVITACLACFIPAWRAVRINPLDALRKE